MLSKRPVFPVVLFLTFALAADVASARAFAFQFQDAPAQDVTVDRQKTVAQLPGQDDSGPDAEHLSTEAFALTVISEGIDRDDPEIIASAARIGFDNLFAAPVQRVSQRTFRLTPQSGFGPSRYSGRTRVPRGGVGRTNRVAAVPLPPALPLMIAALGGLAMFKRQRKSPLQT